MATRRDTHRTILIAEDEEPLRELLATRLILAGYVVLTAQDGLEALSILTERLIDAVILDVNMPNLDGFGVLRRMASMDRMMPPTLVLTARHNADDVKTAIRLGANDYLRKPFDERQLMMRVDRLFRPSPRLPSDSILMGPPPGPPQNDRQI